ncbi:MAG: M20/M25/M40 family metallo-hydrolase [Chitinophagales bacterium]
MKKFLLFLLVVLVILVGIIAFKTSRFKSKQIVNADGKRREFLMDEAAVTRLSNAVKISTISYDDTLKSNQQSYDSFFVFLRQQYATVFEKLEDTVLNNRGLLLKWKGKNENALPVILYAHLDVVPIEETTISEWKHQPFSGDVADGFIWGRGTLDDKGSLISIFEAVNKLVNKNFVPERTVYLAFGSDEEVGGGRGAAAIAEYFRLQKQRFEFYMDEGGMVSQGIVPNINRPVALIGTAEKGYVTLELSVNMPGGHSSRPARETAMDVLVNAVKKLHDNPDKRKISPAVEEFLDYVGPEMKSPFNAVFANRWLFKPLILNEYEKSAEGFALLRTTNVTTVINAGVKENVIPTLVEAKVNYRILTGETVAQVVEHAGILIGDERVKIKVGEIYEPSRNSASTTYGFQLIQQSCAEVFPDAIVTPFLMLGSTDSKHFQDLTENTYRYFPCRFDKELLGTIHGINERIGVKDYMETIAFYETLLTKLK